ncbi:MAG: 50S ribosomal protein L29 [Parcubacteria group bacterium]|jgi:ribosomal protein L29|nr:50S ribosomal protein L29 [Parcubacteria group bacterium]
MAKELAKKNTDLIKELGEKSLALRNLRFGITGSKTKNVKEQKMIKKDIARIKTALNDLNNTK